VHAAGKLSPPQRAMRGKSRCITEHWLMNTHLAVNRLLGSASASAITQSNIQRVVALSMEYSG
jgi:outer membrane scaffolding protein for murein synthesis (MipA/OmpV family)